MRAHECGGRMTSRAVRKGMPAMRTSGWWRMFAMSAGAVLFGCATPRPVVPARPPRTGQAAALAKPPPAPEAAKPSNVAPSPPPPPSPAPAPRPTGKDYVVSPDGSDERGDGSATNPFATIGKGLAMAVPGDRVLLRAGEYRVAEHRADAQGGGKALRFPRAGERGKPITLAAYENEYVALLGSLRLTGWRKHEGDVWKCPHPERHVRGLYEDEERLTHPRRPGKRVDPDVSMLKWPGTWTQDGEWVYVWTREGDSPDAHRIEASQHWVVNVDKPWIRLERLRIFFGQNVCAVIGADHCEVVECEIAHCSNSVDNSYGAYFWGCSNSAFRRCLVRDSYYWGDHGSNSHVVSCIDCGDRGPNFVEECEIFNGGLGVGTKGAAREMVIRECRIYDVVNGIVLSGERSSGPGAGKKDRGHYVVWRNRISDCSRGAYFSGTDNHNNRVWNNVIERCGHGIHLRGAPDRPQIVNNVVMRCGAAIYAVAGRTGVPTIHAYLAKGLASHHNLFFENGADWRNPLRWGKDLDLSATELATRRDLASSPDAEATREPPEQGSVVADPRLDEYRRATAGSPTLDVGARLDLPSYIAAPASWHVGLGPWREGEAKPETGLTLSIAGSQTSVRPGGTLALKAVLVNENREAHIDLDGDRDAIVTFHFRYTSWHFDKQELWRARVQLPVKALAPGETLDLSSLPGWRNPVNGPAGGAFHLRTRDPYDDVKPYQHATWKAGTRLRATVRFVARAEKTADALQRLEPLTRSKELLRVKVE